MGAKEHQDNIPRRSELSPVQRLNREGVTAVEKHEYEKAAALFYKAYLYDPTDPFTLNNLGYISELQADIDRAHKFYALASAQGSSARIDRSNVKQLQGKPMNYAYDGLKDGPMRVNFMNMDAISLISENRGSEALTMLQQALSIDPKDPFTINNLGVAEEAVGDYDSALKYYGDVAGLHSAGPVVITANHAWRGKHVSDMAADSARRLNKRIQDGPAAAHAVLLMVRGVSATNQNDWSAARQDFLSAYSLDPESAFALNNRGYVSEMDGDLETAQYFYGKARMASGSNDHIGLATLHSAEGRSLSAVAKDNVLSVDSGLYKYSLQRRLDTSPIELTPRSNESSHPTDAVPAIAPTSLLPPATQTPEKSPAKPPYQRQEGTH